MNNFSPNMLKTFEACPYKFFLKYIEKINLPQSSKPFEKGKNIHALASYYLSGAKVKKFENVLTKQEKIAWETLKSNKYFNLTPVKTEYQISVKVDKYWVGGRLDALMKDDEDNYFILDYKTGAIPKNPSQDFQTMVYLLSVGKFLLSKNLPTTTLKFVYIDLKNNKSEVIEFNPIIQKKYEENLTKICEKIAKAQYLHTTNPQSCEFSPLCNKCNK